MRVPFRAKHIERKEHRPKQMKKYNKITSKETQTVKKVKVSHSLIAIEAVGVRVVELLNCCFTSTVNI